MRIFKIVLLCMAASISGINVGQSAPIALEGMGSIITWTDYESQANDMPDLIWGNSDTLLADSIGIYVEFENGLTGSATYSGVSGVWNTAYFAEIAADTATGFFTGAGGLHFLFNSSRADSGFARIPMAWDGFVMPFSSNFDISYENLNNSDFRASTAGWQSATFTTYSSSVLAPVPVPAALPLFASVLVGVGFFGWRRKRAISV